MWSKKNPNSEQIRHCLLLLFYTACLGSFRLCGDFIVLYSNMNPLFLNEDFYFLRNWFLFLKKDALEKLKMHLKQQAGSQDYFKLPVNDL